MSTAEELVVPEIESFEIVIEEFGDNLEIITETVIVAVEEVGVEIITEGEPGDAGPIGLQGEPGEPGVNWRDAYDNSATYQAKDGVSYLGSSWRALRTVTGIAPVEGADWTIIAEKGADGTGDSSYVHNQIVAATVWVANHNLGRVAAVVVKDTAGTEVIGDREDSLDMNTTTLTFIPLFSGKAYFS